MLAVYSTFSLAALWYVAFTVDRPTSDISHLDESHLPEGTIEDSPSAPHMSNLSHVAADQQISQGSGTTATSSFDNSSTTSAGPAPICTDRLICHHFEERLGNCLFQYASLLGVSWALNRTAVFSGKPEMDQVLQTPPMRLDGHPDLEKRCSAAKTVFEKSCYKFDSDLLKLDPCVDYRLGSYLQSWRYFDQFQTRIREALTFNQSVRAEAQGIVDAIRAQYSNSTLIGLHVRRGDFEKPMHMRVGYPMAGPDYLNRSVSYFQTRHADSVFVVASENVNWCKANMPAGARVVFLDVHQPEVDLCVLSLTDHIIITFGSFSWWAGYLNPGTTVYMKDFIKSGTQLGKLFNLNGEDYVYPGWIPL